LDLIRDKSISSQDKGEEIIINLFPPKKSFRLTKRKLKVGQKLTNKVGQERLTREIRDGVGG
jgi:hypothetical protein